MPKNHHQERSARIAKERLLGVSRPPTPTTTEQYEPMSLAAEPNNFLENDGNEDYIEEEIIPMNTGTVPLQGKITAGERLKVLIESAVVFPGWYLVAIRRHDEEGIMIAYLSQRKQKLTETALARCSSCMKIIMDEFGNTTVEYPGARKSFWQRFLGGGES